MIFGLELKDVLGPTVSILAALLSIVIFLVNYWWSRRVANRSIYVDGQKFLLEICKHLVSDPDLWCMYDDHVMISEKADKMNDPTFRGKLEAFAHFHLNMFEIVLVEAPRPGKGRKSNQSNVWYEYFHDTLERSQLVRNVLEKEGPKRIWSDHMLKEYARWKDGQIPRA
jgi:hypothetical protein